VPFTVWMMVGYFTSIPRDREEGAMIDGCNHFGALYRIVLPDVRNSTTSSRRKTSLDLCNASSGSLIASAS
jgi:ABC-type glycerol-3-phosphate transport system permease component